MAHEPKALADAIIHHLFEVTGGTGPDYAEGRSRAEDLLAKAGVGDEEAHKDLKLMAAELQIPDFDVS